MSFFFSFHFCTVSVGHVEVLFRFVIFIFKTIYFKADKWKLNEVSVLTFKKPKVLNMDSSNEQKRLGEASSPASSTSPSFCCLSVFLHMIVFMTQHFYMLRTVRRKDHVTLKAKRGDQSDHSFFLFMKLFEKLLLAARLGPLNTSAGRKLMLLKRFHDRFRLKRLSRLRVSLSSPALTSCVFTV